MLLRWDEARACADGADAAWPYEDSLQRAYDTFKAIYEDAGITKLNEWGNDLDWLCQTAGVPTC